jgi:tetratricopeptide (TPR) repeat protein
MFQKLLYFIFMKKEQSKSPDLKIFPAQKKIFFVTTLAIPFLTFAFLEIGLRVFHYGPNLDLFITETIHGIPYYTMNPDIKYRYFSQIQFSPSTSPEDFAVNKPDSTYRIFCLGASTTVGYPYWYNGSFPSLLRNRLQILFPKKSLEIINLGLTATNSNTVIDIAGELVKYQPNLIVLYDGHNEFYGALGTASWESSGSFPWMTKFYLRIIHWKTFWLFRNIFSSAASLFTSSSPQAIERGTMMERMAHGKYIPFRNEEYEITQKIFRNNLNTLKNICIDHRLPLIVCSQVSNMRDLPPFVSEPDPKVTPGEGEIIQTKYRHAISILKGNNIDSACILFNELTHLDSLRADFHYYLAKCYERKSDFRHASMEYTLARDYDQLRFRASSDFNKEISNIADPSHNIFFVDIEKYFRDASPDSIVGYSLIKEHLHPNAKGNFLIAKMISQKMREENLFASASEWQQHDTINEITLWNDRPLSEVDERLADRKTEVLTSAWPFKESAVPIVNTVPVDDTLGYIVEGLVRNTLDWKSAHERAAQYYIQRNEKEKAAKEYSIIISQIPHDVQSYLKEAKIYLELKKYDEVKQILLASLSVDPTILAYRALGDIFLQQDKPQDAVQYYQEIAIFPQSREEQLENGYLLSLALFRSGKIEAARNQLLLILQLKPDFTPAVNLLNKLKK